MKFTGERFMPEFPSDWGSEHLHRYMFARDLCAGKTVLDVASGEGYGSMLLAEVADHVTGVDISDETVCFSREKYRRDNLVYQQGSATALPFAADSFDVVVSYETIEHLTEQDAMMDELARVLRPTGLLIISSPDKREYTEIPDHPNEYHIKELYREEFEALLRARFPHLELYGQRLDYGSLIISEHDAPFFSYDADGDDVTRTLGLTHAMFHIALASRVELPTQPNSIRKFPLLEAEAVRRKEAALNDWKTHALGLERVVEERTALLNKQDTALGAAGETITATRQYLGEVEARLAAAQAYAQEKEALCLAQDRELGRLHASFSWWITRPLRGAKVLARQLVLKACLFPASFAQYPTPHDWFEALRGGDFFKQIQNNSDDLAENLKERSLLWRMLVRKPLCFAQHMVWHGGLKGAVRFFLNRSRRRGATLLKAPALIELMPGLPSADPQARAFLADFPQTPESIAPHAHAPFGSDVDFTGTTTAVVAHWDPEGRVEPYVRHMCRAFKSIGWRVVLASAAPVRDADRESLQNDGSVDAIVYRSCSGYDFTSWKAALACLSSLYACRELVLCNDSVFGGIGSYAPMHERMSGLDCDFWGITESAEKQRHLQSFYLVFRQTALQNPAFRDFFDRVPHGDDRKAAILCETLLTLWLSEKGLRPAAFAPVDLDQPQSVEINPSCEQWETLLKAGVPLLKRELLLKNDRQVPLKGWGNLLAAKGYPLQHIFEYFARKGMELSPATCYASIKKWPPNVLALRTELVLDESAKPALIQKKSAEIGVFLHVFYTELADEMLDSVDNLPAGVFVHVSTDTEAKRDDLLACLDRRGYAGRSEVRVFPNAGWDIAPFLVGYGETIKRYSLILRMHSKRSLHIPGDVGEAWRKMLYTSLAGTPERVNAIVACFEQYPALGMVCPPLVAHYADCVHFGGNFERMRSLLLERGVLISPDMPLDFPMGSMFWCRPEALAAWLEPGFTFDDFAPSADVAGERDCTLAHALERLFFFGCGLRNLSWSRVPELPAPSSKHE